MRKIFVTVRFRQAAVHFWPGAPEGSYLKHPHRHVFHFTVWLEVFHADREVEFIALKEELQAYLAGYGLDEFAPAKSTFSCEDLGDLIVSYLEDTYPGRDIRVRVEEDGENGAYLEAEKDD